MAAFVSGGLVPEALRGTTNDMRFHIVDWYPTFCFLAGVDGSDDSPTPPKAIDPALGPGQDICPCPPRGAYAASAFSMLTLLSMAVLY